MNRKVAVLVFLLLALCGLVFAENALADDFFDDSTSDPVAATGTPLIIVGGKRSAPAARMMTMPKSLSSFNTQKPMQLTVPNSSNVYVDAHNAYRSKHRVPNLSWDASLASSAQAYSTKCQITHSMIPGIGENLAWNTKAEGAAASAIDGWYNEMSLYNYAAPQFSVATGHFTAMIWRATTKIGCGSSVCPNLTKNGRTFTLTVCHYNPQGNEISAFAANVPPKA